MTATVAGYRVLETLASSESRTLLRAVDADGTPVVLKVLAAERATPAEIARLRHELAVAADLPDEFAVRPLRIAEFGGGAGLVLPDLGGVAMADLIPAGGFDTTTLLRVAGLVAEAVAAVHAGGLLHRDLKPDNLLADPDLSWVRVADFGLATPLALAAAPESPVGTLAYLAPEQTGRMNRTVDARSDLYSLGVTLYQMATGRLPFATTGALETVHAHLAVSPADPWTLRADLPEPVAAILLRLLAKQPEDRYQSAASLRADLATAANSWAGSGTVPAFELGTTETTGPLAVPERLFGRDTELAELAAAVADAADGRGRLVLLAGGPGVGKSALVAELGPTIAAAGGRFAARKFDQYAGGFQPPSAVLGALSRQVLREPPATVAQVRADLADRLGANLGVLTEISPELALLVGEQPAPARLGPVETRARFALAWAEFCGVFARPGRPLVLLFDDVQWALEGNVDLLAAALAHEAAAHLLVLAAYRPDEMPPDHPLLKLAEGLDPDRVLRIDLQPFGGPTTSAVVAATFGGPQSALADRLHELSGGNPFHLRQVLAALIAEAGPEAVAGWCPDPDQVATLGLTGDVVGFVVGRLAELPEHTRDALQVAALIGNRFSAALLATATELTEDEVVGALAPAVAAGLAVRVGEEGPAHYRFVHDRVQQAAHATIAVDARPLLSLRIGRSLRSRLDAEPGLLPAAVAHLNAAADLLSSAERVELAVLNLAAAAPARASGAYAVVVQLLERTDALLPPDRWANHYDLVFQVHLSLGEALGVLGRVDEAEQVLATALDHAATDEDAALVCGTRGELLVRAARMGEGYEAIAQGMVRLGVALPENDADIATEIAKVFARLAEPGLPQRLGELSLAGPEAVALARLLDQAVIPTFFARPAVLALIAGAAVDHALRAGLTPYSATGAMAVAIPLGLRGDLQLWIEMCRAAREINLRAGILETRPKTEVGIVFHGLCWCDPAAECDRAAEEAFGLAQTNGDLQIANYAVELLHLSAVAAARDCSRMLTTLTRWSEHSRQYMAATTGMTAVVAHFLGRWAGTAGEAVDVDHILRTYQDAGDVTLTCQALGYACLAEALVGEYAEAHRHGRWAEPLQDGGAGGISLHAMFHFVGYPIAAARLASDTTDPEERAALLATVDTFHDRIQRFGLMPPGKFACYAHLVSAERHRARGEDGPALHAYAQAIEAATADGYTLVAGWANELLGRFHLERGRRLGRAHLAEALRLFDACGAAGKVARLDAEFPDVGASGQASPLDLTTVVAASQEIAAQVSPDRVVSALVAVAIAATGAEGGAFVSPGAPVTVGDGPGVLEFPLRHKGELLGTLVLERARPGGAQATAILDLLAPQVGISLENARLYADLEAKVADRAAELQATMTQLSAMQDQIVQSEKLAALGGLVAGVAHEINNPVGVALAASSHLVTRTQDFRSAWSGDKLRRSELDDFVRTAADAAEIILSNADRAAALVASFKQVAVDQAAETRREFALGPYLADVVASLTPKLRHTPHHVEIDVDPDLRLSGYPGALAQVATNLVLNSLLHAYPEDHPGGVLRFAGVRHGADIRLTYSDDGAGVPPEDLPQLFDAFFTTRRGTGGSGLGLHIVHNLVTQSLAGTIAVHSEFGHGTAFVIDLPTHSEA